MDEKQYLDRLDNILTSLPKAIHVWNICKVLKSFHSRFDCIGKRYVYTIIQNERTSPFECRYAWNIIRKATKPALNIVAMTNAASHLIGEHDFTPFSVQYKNKVNHTFFSRFIESQ